MSNRRRRRAGQPLPIRESAATATARIHGAPVRNEPAGPAALTFTEATTGGMRKTGSRRYRARLIEGDRWGSSGYYPAKVLERDGPSTWPAGTLMYLDHPTLEEQVNRPERSVRDLAAVTTSIPVYEGDGLYANIDVFPHAAQLVEAMADTIGLSVRGEGTATVGTVAGRTGPVIESLDAGYSVDFVTRAGAGGKLVGLLEAARNVPLAEGRNVGAWLESRLHLALTELGDDMYGQGRLTRAERITLSSAIGDALQAWTARVEADAPQLFQRDLYEEPEPAEGDNADAAISEAATEDIRRVLCDLVYDAQGQPGRYLWVRDYDDARRLVWWDVSPDDDGDNATYQQGYTVDDQGRYALTGDPVEVVARTVYQPVTEQTEEVAESAKPPAAEPDSTTHISVQEGAQPTAPTREESLVDPAKTGTTPGTGPAAVTEAAPARTVLGEAERLSQLLAENRTALAEANGRADKAETRATAAEKRATLAEAKLAAVGTIRTALGESQLKPASYEAVTAAVCDSLELTESGKVDEAKLAEAIKAEIQREETRVAQLLESYGVGRVAGLGGATAGGTDPSDEEIAAAFGRLGLSESDARMAAAGRRN